MGFIPSSTLYIYCISLLCYYYSLSYFKPILWPKAFKRQHVSTVAHVLQIYMNARGYVSGGYTWIHVLWIYMNARGYVSGGYTWIHVLWIYMNARGYMSSGIHVDTCPVDTFPDQQLYVALHLFAFVFTLPITYFLLVFEKRIRSGPPMRSCRSCNMSHMLLLLFLQFQLQVKQKIKSLILISLQNFLLNTETFFRCG